MNGNSERKPIWLDCDPGVDDMIAIMLAVQNPKINLLGISTIGGNISTEKVVKNALNIINISGFPEIPILKGCSDPICRETGISSTHGQSGLGPDFAFPLHHLKVKEKNLFAYLSEVIMNFPVKITLISTGPLTNFALLLKTYPEVKTNIDSIVFMGGRIKLIILMFLKFYHIYFKVVLNLGIIHHHANLILDGILKLQRLFLAQV